MSTISKRSGTKLRSWHFLNIEAKRILLIPKFEKIEVKRTTVLIQELKKIGAKLTWLIPEI
jgi:hypothetical protein